MKKLLILILLISSSSYGAGDNRCDYRLAAQKQKDLVEKIADFEIDISSQLILEASQPYDPKDEDAKNLRKIKLKIATEKFVKHQYLNDVSDEMSRGLYLVDSLESLKAFHGNMTKSKFYLKNSAKVLKAWMTGMAVNTASMKNLKTEIRNEVIESILKSAIGNNMPKMTDDEALLLTYLTDFSVKAGMDIRSQLLAGQAVRFGGSEMLLRWAGGPVGIITMIAPLFLSGTLPPETKWTDVLEKHPELILNPELMTKTGITSDAKHATLIHCWAWERRDYFMERRADKIIANEKKRIAQAIKYVQDEPVRRRQMESWKYPQRDNTYVRKPVIMPLKTSGR